MDKFLIGTHRNSRDAEREFYNLKAGRGDNSDINHQLDERMDVINSPLRNSCGTNASVL